MIVLRSFVIDCIEIAMGRRGYKAHTLHRRPENQTHRAQYDKAEPWQKQSFEPINHRMRFPALDGVRAVAVLMVFAFHYGGGAHRGPLLKVADAIRLQGWAGVDVFFVLSGFLITGVLYDTRNDSRFFSRFYARRSIRIFPVYYLVALMLLILTPVFHYQWHAVHLLFLIYLGNIPGAFVPTIYQIHARVPAADVYLGHLWSLCVEEQFYLLWPLAGVGDRGSRVKLMWTAVGLSMLAVAMRVWMVLGSGVDLRGGWLLNMLPFPYGHPADRRRPGIAAAGGARDGLAESMRGSLFAIDFGIGGSFSAEFGAGNGRGFRRSGLP